MEDERLNSNPSNPSSSDRPRKRDIADKFFLNFSSESNLDNSSDFLNLENKFFIFDKSYKQQYLLSKSFDNIKSSEFLKKIDEFFEKEQELNKKSSKEEFTIEAIIEKLYSDGNKSSSSNIIFQNVSGNSDLSKKKYSFLIISNSCLYDLDYHNDTNSINLKRKILISNIEFFSITSDFVKLILHINSNVDLMGNFGITHENSIKIAFCLSTLGYVLSKNKKVLIVVPKSNMLVDKIKYITSLEKYK